MSSTKQFSVKCTVFFPLMVALLGFVCFSSAFASRAFVNVALVSVSTQFDQGKIPYIVKVLKNKKYTVTTRYLKGFPFQDLGYTDAEIVRAKALIAAFKDPNVDIVWFVRGGGGAFNLLPYLSKQIGALRQVSPKVVVGFSDVTAIHNFVNDKLGWRSVHGVLAGLNADLYAVLPAQLKRSGIKVSDRQSIPSIHALYKNGVAYDNIVPLNKQAREGVKAKIVGGNFTLVYSTFSTKYEPDWNNKVLFLEDVGVSFRQLDRNLHQLLFKKNFNVKAIIFGQFFSLKSTTEQILAYKTALERFAKKFKKPVYYYPVMGHGRENKPIIFNAYVSLQCFKGKYYCRFKQTGGM